MKYALPNYVARASLRPQRSRPRRRPATGPTCSGTSSTRSGSGCTGAWDNAIAAGQAGRPGRDRRGARHRRRLSHDREAATARRPTSAAGASSAATTSFAATRFPFDRNGHGTFITGTVAQETNNGIGVTGVAYESRIMPVRVLDFEGKGDVATIASGIRFAARRGAQIINMSFEFDIGLTASQIPDVISAIRYAHRKGAVLVGAAGNAEDTRVAYPALATQRDQRRRDDRARLPRRVLEHRLRARPRRSGRRRRRGRSTATRTASRFESAGRDVFQYTFTGPGLPQLRPAVRLRGHVDVGAARVRHDRADARDRRARAEPDARGDHSTGSSRRRATSARPATTRPTAGA